MNKKITGKDRELFYDRFSDEWESKINNWETRKRIKVVFGKMLNTKDLKNKKFLEVGCGLGYFSEVAVKKGANVTGIDVGAKLVKLAKRRAGKGKFITASASDLPFKDATFDTILCTEVIEHVLNQRRAISEISRVLKPHGVLVITTPNKFYKSIFDLLSWLRIRPYHGIENWLYFSEIKKTLEKNGFVVLASLYFNLFINYGIKLKKINKST